MKNEFYNKYRRLLCSDHFTLCNIAIPLAILVFTIINIFVNDSQELDFFYFLNIYGIYI